MQEKPPSSVHYRPNTALRSLFACSVPLLALILMAGDALAGTKTPNQRVFANGKSHFVVAIDAGHGGKDSGAIGPKGTQEKDLVLSIAKRLYELLRHEPGIRPILIRPNDQFITLRKRAEAARDREADLFISLHADAESEGEARGTSVFTLSENGATSEAARCLADRENAGEVAGVDLKTEDAMVASVLVDLSKNATAESSEQAATQVLHALQREFKVHQSSVQKAGFAVLKSLDVPSLLVETGFISNAEEEQRLSDPKQQDRLARALFRGVRNFAKAASADNPTLTP